jgi:PmbA protein
LESSFFFYSEGIGMQIWNITYDNIQYHGCLTYISAEVILINSVDMVSLGGRAIQSGRKMGADMVEVYLSSSRELQIEVRDEKVETMKLAEERGLGLRIMKGATTGFAFTSDLKWASVEEIVGQAMANASKVSEDRYRTMPAPSPVYPRVDLYDRKILDTPVTEKIRLAVDMEAASKKYDPRVKIIEGSTYTDTDTEITLMNSLGVNLSFKGAYCGIYIALVAVEGADNQTGLAMKFSINYDDLNAADTGREAAARAVRMLGARTVPSQSIPVVFEPYVATGFLGLLAPALTAEAVQKGRSLFAGKVGQKVASEKVTIVDDGSRAGGIASSPFDGEGVPTSRTALISGGLLEGFLHNTYTAAKDGVQSTGNGVRGSYKATPEVGTTNFFIEKGESHPSAILSSIEKGFYVTEVMGMHTANPISGDFSLGVSGLMIEGGRLAYPVRGVALAGNIIDLLKRVEAVGSDLTFFGGTGAPTLCVGKMSLSGH